MRMRDDIMVHDGDPLAHVGPELPAQGPLRLELACQRVGHTTIVREPGAPERHVFVRIRHCPDMRLLAVGAVVAVLAASRVYVFRPATALSTRQQTAVERIVSARARALGVHLGVDASARSVRLAVRGSASKSTLAALTAPGRLELLDLEANLVRTAPSQSRPRVANGQIAVRCGPPAPVCPRRLASPTHALWYVMRDRPVVRTAD